MSDHHHESNRFDAASFATTSSDATWSGDVAPSIELRLRSNVGIASSARTSTMIGMIVRAEFGSAEAAKKVRISDCRQRLRATRRSTDFVAYSDGRS